MADNKLDEEWSLCKRCGRNFFTGKDDAHQFLWHTYHERRKVEHDEYGMADL